MFEVIIPLADCDKELLCKYCGKPLEKIIMPVMFKV
jgi:hypothetical protein